MSTVSTVSTVHAGSEARRLAGLLARRSARVVAGTLVLGFAAGTATIHQFSERARRPLPDPLPPAGEQHGAPPLAARGGEALSASYLAQGSAGGWNLVPQLRYHQFPKLLVDAVIQAEDRRFWRHRGVDWRARASALVQNLRARRAVRGASTHTEPVVGLLHPRPRGITARWVEGVEARELERRQGKTAILEFYLNQVPYARNRRGVAQAARLYFDRDLETLTPYETLALAVLVRSPSRLDPLRNPRALHGRVLALARHLGRHGLLSGDEYRAITRGTLALQPHLAPLDAGHFVRFVRERSPPRAGTSAITTTLDTSLQPRVQQILDRRLRDLAGHDVSDGAVLVVDHETSEVLAWVNGGGFGDHPGGQIDKVIVPRQPGSTLKPFVYGLALERGWSAATLIADEPLMDPVGQGMHSFRNYSRTFYGPVRLRDALGNSLNTPAVRAVKHVSPRRLLDRLHDLGFTSLDRGAEVYGDGLALGNGEVTLLELVQGYAAIARGGVFRPVRVLRDEAAHAGAARAVFDPEITSLLASILADDEARRLEFGVDSVLALPWPTAVKTGTSNDHRDAWAVGFSDRHTVGVWMGNVDRRPTRDVVGSVGPALVLRAVFGELNRHRQVRPLLLAPTLAERTICRESGARAGASCPVTTEWFRRRDRVAARCPLHERADDPAHDPALAAAAAPAGTPHIESPTPGLLLALDPRIPDQLEAFAFELGGLGGQGAELIEWLVDDARVAETTTARYEWPVARGHHRVFARVHLAGGRVVATDPVGFTVR